MSPVSNFTLVGSAQFLFPSSSISSLRITFRKPRDSAFNSFLRPKGGELVWCHKDRRLWRCDIFFCFARAATAECSIVYNHTSPKQNEQQGRTGKQPTTTRNCRSRFLHKRCIDSHPQSVLALLQITHHPSLCYRQHAIQAHHVFGEPKYDFG